jgi:hypothetical protein
MLTPILSHFPPYVYPLTLVSDPDDVLADELALAHLAERGFTLIRANDPIGLRLELAQVGEWSAQRPFILITPHPLNQLPYDLWQQGHHVTLALHTFFPALAYPVLQSLSPNQRWRLAQLPPPPQKLGRQGSAEFILRHLFTVIWEEVATPAGLIGWLNRYHQGEAMPPLLVEQWLAKTQPQHPAWPLADWLSNREAFQTFISQEWRQFITDQTEKRLGERKVGYQLPFAADEKLQDALPQLARSGALQPVTLADAAPLPAWAQVGVRTSPADFAQQRADALLSTLAEQAPALAEARWEQWQTAATAWAELTALRHQPKRYLTGTQQADYAQWRARLDAAFAVWLEQRYAPLAGQRLPQPHHLFHVLHWLAYERRRHPSPGRVALLVLDGLSLAAWTTIAPVWRERHPAWRFDERLVLAQIPSLTAVSRQALISGERPANFADSLGHNRYEKRLWASFWARENVPAAACAYEHLALGGERPLPDALTSSRTQALCLINNSIDEMVHGATQGLTGVHASLYAWLGGEEGRQLEVTVGTLLAQGYTVYLSSDHGHTEAWGMGQPAEGVTVQTRSKRARLYNDHHAALAVQANFPQTTMWPSQRILPEGTWVLLAGVGENGRRLAFAPQGERVVTHGGATLDELVVPLVRLT